jgi:hypothetical protein
LEFLTEDTIKRATLSFMKTYYKFRPRTGETSLSYDRIHSSGVIVDGYLEFPKDDGNPFVATFEATSSNTSSEVRYSLQRQQLLWDALAAGSVGALVVMLVLWFYNVWSISSASAYLGILLILTLVGIFTAAYHLTFRTAGRYRYIYAIEQFKQYHADEQWIAIGDDVFTEGSDPNFMELKNQCVENGFGLVLVDGDESVNLLITPAREDVFGKKRRTLKFMENASVQSLKNVSTRNLERYRRPYMAQMATCVLSFAVMSGLFYRQYQARPVDVVINEGAYQDSLAVLSNRLEEEPNVYLYKKQDVALKDKKAKSYEETVPMNVVKAEVGFYVYTPTDGYLIYDCARAGVRGTKYVVQDQVTTVFEQARKRIEQLKSYGLIANAISLSCTESSTKGYCVYYELMFTDQKSANRKALEIKQNLTDLRLPNDNIQLRILKF